jgi:hypothetical protein
MMALAQKWVVDPAGPSSSLNNKMLREQAGPAHCPDLMMLTFLK